MGGKPQKPKIQAYVEQRWFDEFEVYRTTHNLNQSRALEKILAQFFGGDSSSTLPPDEAITTSTLVDTLRSELADLRLELDHRLQLVESRLAIESVSESVIVLTESAGKSAILTDESANESAAELTESADESAGESVTGQAESALGLDESAVHLDGLATESANKSAVAIAESASESAIAQDESALPLDESVSESASESAIVENAIAVNPLEDIAVVEANYIAGEDVDIADDRNTLEDVPDTAALSSEPVEEIAPVDQGQQLTRNQLGKLFKKSHDTIRRWEEADKLAALGWEPVPGTGGSSKNPRIYRPVSESANHL